MHRDELRTLVVSRLYPRPSDPVLGIFVEEEVKELSRHCQIKVVSPIPWFPPLKRFRKWYPYAQVPAREIREGIEVFRPRAIFDKKITIYGGEQWRPFVHVDDVADAIIRCLEAPLAVVSGQVFNVGSDAGNYRLIQIGDIIKRAVPDVEVSVQQNAEDERNYRVSSESIRRMVGFSANKTVEDAIQDIVGAVRTGRIVNYRDPRYSNVKWLTENGETAITMVPNIYSVVMRMPEGMSATG